MWGLERLRSWNNLGSLASLLSPVATVSGLVLVSGGLRLKGIGDLERVSWHSADDAVGC